MLTQRLNKKNVLMNNAFYSVLIAVVFSTDPCFSDDKLPGMDKRLDAVTLQLKWKHQFQFAGYYAALEKGFYRQVGLGVRIIEANAGEESTDQVISGEADFGIAMSAYSTDEPFMLLEKGIKHVTFSPRSGGIDFYGDTLFTSESQVREHPERVAAFLGASLKGWRYALDNTEEIVDLILSKYTTRHSRDHLLFEARMSKRLIMADVVELGYMNPGRWLHIADFFKKMDRIPNDFSLEGFIYDRKSGSYRMMLNLKERFK
jgi:ABC-type nitrate/sulfonate/bicarbonate transport system substrate-binding protein